MQRLAVRDYPASLSFDGSTTAVALGNVLNAGVGDLTLNIWFKTKNSQTLQGMITKKTDLASTGAIGYSLFLEIGRIRAAVSDGTNLGRRDSSTSLVVPNGVWCMASMRWEAATGILSVFFNGVPNQATQFGTAPTASLTTTEQLRFGSDNGARRFMNGNLSDGQVWLRALSDQEISDLYSAGVQAVTSAGRWKMIEGAGGTLFDSVGVNNGTITGGTFTFDSPMKFRSQVGGNLIKNGDFEYAPPFTAAQTATSSKFYDGSASGSSSNRLFGWNAFISVSGSTYFDSSVSNSGTYSLKASLTGIGSYIEVFKPTESGGLGGYFGKHIAVLPNTSYTFSFWMRTNYISGDSNDGAFVSVLESKADGTTASSTTTSTKVKTTTSWTKYTYTITTSSTTAYVQINPRIYGHTGTGTLLIDAWFDDFFLGPVYPDTRTAVEGNLVKNFDFEVFPTLVAPTTTRQRWIDGSAGGSSANQTCKWCLNGTNSSSTGIAAQFDTVEKFSGLASMKVSTTLVNSVAAVSNVLTSTQSDVEAGAIRIKPNTTYAYRFRMKTNYVSGDSASGAFIQFTERNASGSAIQSTLSTFVKTTTGWLEYTGTFSTLSTSVWMTPILFVTGNSGAATLIMDAWFDDISITPVYREVRPPVYGNLVSNWDFEVFPALTAPQNTAGTWLNGSAGGSAANSTYKWTIPSAAISASATASFDTTVFHNGSASLKLDVTDTSGTVVVSNVINSAIGNTTGAIKIKPNTAYSFSAWVKTSTVGTNGVYMDVRQFNSLGGTITTTSSNKLSGTNDWTQITGSFTSDSAAKDVCIILRNGVAGQVSTAWFDEIVLIPSTPVTRTSV